MLLFLSREMDSTAHVICRVFNLKKLSQVIDFIAYTF